MKPKAFQCVIALLSFVPVLVLAQANSGSNGSDGAFNPTTNTVVDMHDHPNGIYQYTSVNIPTNVTVAFIPNANNTPATWLVQGNAVINGVIDVSGQNANGPTGGNGGNGGPGGWAGGNGGSNPSAGQGPGGGNGGIIGCCGSFGTQGRSNYLNQSAGQTYGNSFLFPLLGGSGGGGGTVYSIVQSSGGGGGGGAILIAASGSISVDGQILAYGGNNFNVNTGAGGSGGGIRIIASILNGNGAFIADGGNMYGYGGKGYAGAGRIRFDVLNNNFGGQISGSFSQGFQPIIIPTAAQGAQLTVASIGGVPVSTSPTGQFATPDAVLSAQQNNPIPVIVNCANLPLRTLITVTVKPANGAIVTAMGYNDAGTQGSSTATVPINIPRGGGLIYATAATGN